MILSLLCLKSSTFHSVGSRGTASLGCSPASPLSRRIALRLRSSQSACQHEWCSRQCAVTGSLYSPEPTIPLRGGMVGWANCETGSTVKILLCMPHRRGWRVGKEGSVTGKGLCPRIWRLWRSWFGRRLFRAESCTMGMFCASLSAC